MLSPLRMMLTETQDQDDVNVQRKDASNQVVEVKVGTNEEMGVDPAGSDSVLHVEAAVRVEG